MVNIIFSIAFMLVGILGMQVEDDIKRLNEHQEILGKAIKNIDYQIDIIAESIKK